MWPLFTRVNENLGATYVTRHSALNSIFRDIGKNSTICNVNKPQPKTDFLLKFSANFKLGFENILVLLPKEIRSQSKAMPFLLQPTRFDPEIRHHHMPSVLCVQRHKCLFPLLFISCISTKHSPYYFNLNINT